MHHELLSCQAGAMSKSFDKKHQASASAIEKRVFAQLSSYQHRAQQALVNIGALLDLQFDLITLLDSLVLPKSLQQESIALISHLLRDRYGQQAGEHMPEKFKQTIQADFKLYIDLINAQFKMVSRFAFLNAKKEARRESEIMRADWLKRWITIVRRLC